MADASQKWRFFLSPEETWASMYDDCERATQSIEMEQYIFFNDEIGQKFLKLFIEKVSQGVHVRLLCDDVGSGSFRHSDLVAEFRQKGGIFHFYNSIKLIDLFKPRQIFPRTHLKALVIDTHVAYIGGVCVAIRMKNWRDTHIRIMGPVVKQIETALDRNAEELLGPGANRSRQKAVPFQPADPDFVYVQNDPAFRRHPIYQEMLKHISVAEKYIYISSAFFIPTRRLRRYLIDAAARGVKTVVLMPSHSDSELADWACLSYLSRLIQGGVHIYMYEPSVLHTKTAVIDGSWGTVGSCNMDPLSFFHNREANLLVADQAALAEMTRDYENDLKSSKHITLEVLKQIPLWKRAASHFARLFRPIL